MQVPLAMSFRSVQKDRSIEDLIRARADKLGRVCDHLMSCRVGVERRQMHQEIGNPYRVRIDMMVSPGHELVVRREPSKGYMHDPLDVVVRDAFNAAERQLQKLVQQQRREVKSHLAPEALAIVHKLFPDRGYGFLRTLDTVEEVYFHRNSVLRGGFGRLKVGMGVRYTPEVGDNGLQATTVQIVARQGPPLAPAYQMQS
jgi:cold shock CspA family protein